jgi:hypothetical protein
LQKIVAGLNACSKEQSRASDERTKLTTRLAALNTMTSPCVEEIYQLLQNDRDQNNEKYVALEARLDGLSTSSFEKLSAFESRVELMNESAEQRVQNIAKDMQTVGATVRGHSKAFSQKLVEVNMAMAEQRNKRCSGENLVDMDVIMKLFKEEQTHSLESLQNLELSVARVKQLGDEQCQSLEKTERAINKRLDDERARTQESLQKIEAGLSACTKEQSRALDERTKLTTRLDVVESNSNGQLDPDSAALKTMISSCVEEMYQLLQNDRDQNNEKYVVVEARLDGLSTSSFEKLSAFESRVELMNASAEQRVQNIAKHMQAVDATVRDQWTAYSQKLVEVKMAMAQLKVNICSGENLVDMDVIMKIFEEEQTRSSEAMKKLELSIVNQSGDVVRSTERAMKRLDDERARTQESLQKIEAGLSACTTEQSRASDERTKLTTRLNVIEQKSNAILDGDAAALIRIEAVESRLQAMDCTERELRKASIQGVALASRMENVEAALAKGVALERMTNMEKLHKKFRDETSGIISRIDAIESSVSNANLDALAGASLEQVKSARIAASAEKKGTESKAITDIVREAPAALRQTQARPARSTTLHDEVLKSHTELLQKIAKPLGGPLARTPQNLSPRSASKASPPSPPRTRNSASQPTQQVNISKLVPDAKSSPIKTNATQRNAPKKFHAW